MLNNNGSYDFIREKIQQLKELHPVLRNKSDDYVFSVLSIKSNFYKNPLIPFTPEMMLETVVDGTNDGGVDAILTDPNSEESSLVLVQSKFYKTISFDEIQDAISKLVNFYKSMSEGNLGVLRENVDNRFVTLNSEVGDESKIIFVIYTSAKKGGIRNDRLDKVFKNLIPVGNDKYELRVYFADDIVEEIKESESRRPTVETGKLVIDKAKNCLWYGDEDAVIVSVSAYCIKELYALHFQNLLSKNLRFHVNGPNVDKGIDETIKNDPEDFWFKNNGLTIICDDFEVSGKEVKLKNFSIVNGGQTTYKLYKNTLLNKERDFYLPCKIIRVRGDTQEDKDNFILEIAKATNSQKAIKAIDLKANSPEQIRFSTAMKSVGIFYQTKRGEKPAPGIYNEDYKKTDLADTGKLCLAAIFQLPATSRNRPSTLYDNEYYEPIFNGNQEKISKLVKELLYIDYYFRNSFLKKFDVKEQSNPNASELIPFAHNARTICIAFAAFAARYKAGNIDSDKLSIVFNNIKEGGYQTKMYDIFIDVDSIKTFFSSNLFENKDQFDEVLYELFDAIIKNGRKCYANDKLYDTSLNESNYLKKDNNYYSILKREWDTLEEKIDLAFSKITS